MPSISDMTDDELVAWMTTFVTVAGPNPAKYGITAAQIIEITAARNDLQTLIDARNAAEDAFRSSVTAQQDSRKTQEPKASYIYQSIKINTAIPDADKEAVGVSPNKPRTKTPPVRPESLVVNGYEDGRNVLKWKRAGNKATTQFIIEVKFEGETAFAYLATTTDTKFEQLGVKPGRRATYRVKAQRSGEESTYSNEASVY